LVKTAAALVVMNDWGTTASMIATARSRDVPVLAVVEGVQDFADVETGRKRSAYRNSDHVFCLGPYDHAQLDGVKRSIGGSTRFQKAWATPVTTQPDELVVVNSNFSYGVLESERKPWVDGVRRAAAGAETRMVLSRHPAERGLDFGDDVTKVPISQLLKTSGCLVSRFSTVCFDALLAGVPMIYYNPHGEQIGTFREANGAFISTTSVEHLQIALRAPKRSRQETRYAAEGFLSRHLLLHSAVRPAEHVANVICSMV